MKWKKDAEIWAEEKQAFETRKDELEKELKELKGKAQEQPMPTMQSSKVPNASEVFGADSLS